MCILISHIVTKAQNSWTLPSKSLSDKLGILLRKLGGNVDPSEKTRVLTIFGVLHGVILESHFSLWASDGAEARMYL